MASARKLAEERLRASESRLRTILDSEPECVKTVSVDGRLLEMNPAGLRMLEAEGAAEVLGRQILELVHAEDRAPYLELHKRVARGGTGQLQFRIIGLKGTERWMETQSVALRADDGSVSSVLSVTRDISERKRAEAALRASEAKYRALIENMADGLVLADRDEVIRFVNLQACRLLGYSAAELLGRNATDLLFREEDQAAIAARNRRRAEGITESYEIEVRKRSGELFWAHFSVAPVTDADGRFTGSMAILADITERKQNEAALLSSELQLRSFIENAPADIAMFDNDMICLAASRRWISAYGRGRPTPVGISHYELNPDLPERWKEIHRRGLAGESLVCDEDVWTRSDGSQQWLRWSMDPWRDPKGAIGGIVLFLEDISARKRAEEAILAEKAFSEAMLDSLPGIFYLIDPAGRLLRWNRSLEKTFGYTAEEVAGMKTLDLVAIEDRPRIEEILRGVFTTGAADAEAELVTKDGKRTPYFLTGLRFTVEGRPCCIGTGIDLSARKLLEAELQQSQKIEAIGRLAGGVAHDFNNILGVILGYGELAESELEPGSPAREQVGEMVKAAHRAATLTRQLQAFSRKQILQPKPLDLNALVANAHSLLGRLIGEDIRLVLSPAPGLGTVRADPGQIDQILLNLAVNARDAMPKGGTLTLETANIDLHEEYAAAHWPAKPGSYVMVAVSDTGVGMDAETQQRVFEPFFTTKPEGQGTGLGLSTVYGIVKQSDGYIWVYSEPGFGTTIKIYLPRVDQLPEADLPGVPLASTTGGSETILLVEDNPALREMIRRRLVGCGYAVLLAGDGKEALALAAAGSGPIDLLLTDVVMPNLGGAELAQRMGTIRSGLRVLFMSGYTDGAIVQHGVLAEGVVLLEKPFSGERLLRAVRVVLDQPPVSELGSESSLHP